MGDGSQMLANVSYYLIKKSEMDVVTNTQFQYKAAGITTDGYHGFF